MAYSKTVWANESTPAINETNLNKLEQGIFDSRDSANIAFTASGAGAVERTVSAKMNDFVSVKDFGAVGDGVEDDAAAIQAALNSGYKSIYFPSGDYLVSSTLTVKSSSRMFGDGRSSRIVADDSFASAPIVVNENNTATELTDQDIVIENIFFNYTGELPEGGAQHSVYFRYVDRPRVNGCYFEGGNNGTAFLACKDSLVTNCHAVDVKNCSFDHWDGIENAVVHACTARSSDANQGIMFTGTATDRSPRASTTFTVSQCQVYGCSEESQVAILINALDADSSVVYANIFGNYVSGANMAVALTGVGGGHIVANNIIHETVRAGIQIKEDDGGPINDCTVFGNTFIDCDVTASNVALVSISSGAGHIIRDNLVTGGSYPYFLWLTTDECFVSGNIFQTGTTGRILNSGSNSLITDINRSTGGVTFNNEVNVADDLYANLFLANPLNDVDNGGKMRLIGAGSNLGVNADNFAGTFRVYNEGTEGTPLSYNPQTASLIIDSSRIVTTRQTGWTQASGSSSRSTFDTTTVTTEQLAERVKALVDDLFAHGLIGN